MPLKAYKLNPSYVHKFYFFMPIFLKKIEYMIFQELPLLISIREMPKWPIVAVITNGKISLGIPLSFSLSQKLSIFLSRTLINVLLPLLLTAINSLVFLFIVTLDGEFSRRVPPMMVAICLRFCLCASSYLLLSFLPWSRHQLP